MTRRTRLPTENTASSVSSKSVSGFPYAVTIYRASHASAVPILSAAWSVPSAPARPCIHEHDYFRPFSCKGFYLCPSCSRKRTILFAEHLVNDVLLRLPHRQFVFTIPKMLRPFFRHNCRLFAEVSRLIYDILGEFYCAAAGRPLLTGIVVAHQTFGDMLRWNPHFHAIVLEGWPVTASPARLCIRRRI